METESALFMYNEQLDKLEFVDAGTNRAERGSDEKISTVHVSSAATRHKKRGVAPEKRTERVLQSAADLLISMLAGGKHTSAIGK